ncbi:MAG: redoxin domain-containing protein [Thermoplasmata archaeon]|nr:redoxin domain-containing protein [Thermoplasmata archaeon]
MIAHNFCLPDENGNKICLHDFKGKWIVLYFYLRDNTTGCTKEREILVNTLVNWSKMTYKKMLQNLGWATGYNVFAIPLGAGVLYGYGILISPAIGALLMSLSTIIVAINAKLMVEK